MTKTGPNRARFNRRHLKYQPPPSRRLPPDHDSEVKCASKFLCAAVRADAYMNRQYLDPLLKGSYPEEMHEIFGAAWPALSTSELREIQQPIDFLGINYYTRSVVQHDSEAPPVCATAVPQPRATHMTTGWEVHPESLTRTLCWVKERYGDMPLYVTENGGAFYDPPMARGVDVRGYFAWSLLDNLEWSAGFTHRFGLVHVDFETQKRTLKSSADFYRNVIRTGGAHLDV